jgi:predicted transcriptional regulator
MKKKLALVEKIRIGLEQSEQGKVHTREHVKKRLKKWLKYESSINHDQ